MNDWESQSLGADELLLEAQPGFACGKKDVAGGVPHLRMNNVSKDGTLDMTLIRRVPRDIANRQNRFLQPGDVIFNNTNSTELVGKSCIFTGWDEPCTFSNHLTLLRPNPASLLTGWLYLCLRHLWLGGFFAANCTEFIGQSAFNKQELLKVEIPVPPLGEQRRLVGRVEALTARLARARQARQAATAEAETVMQALLDRLFSEDAKRRVAIGDLGEVKGGIQKTPDRTPGANPVRYLTVAHVRRDEILVDDPRYFEVTPDELQRWRLQPGDVLVIEGNGSEDQIGRAALFTGEIKDCVHQNHVIRVRPNRAVIEPAFMNAFLNSPTGRREVRQRGHTSTGLLSLSVGRIKQIEVPVPPLERQREAIAQIDALRAKAAELARLQGETEALLASFAPALLAKAFRGEL